MFVLRGVRLLTDPSKDVYSPCSLPRMSAEDADTAPEDGEEGSSEVPAEEREATPPPTPDPSKDVLCEFLRRCTNLKSLNLYWSHADWKLVIPVITTYCPLL